MTIKSYTSIAQSQVLAEILPLESADMWLAERYAGQCLENGQYIVEKKPVYYPSHSKPSNDNYSQDIIKDIPCWSLAALLNNIPQAKLDNIKQYNKKHWRCCAYFASDWHNSDWHDNPVDACYEMVLKLHEQKLL